MGLLLVLLGDRLCESSVPCELTGVVVSTVRHRSLASDELPVDGHPKEVMSLLLGLAGGAVRRVAKDVVQAGERTGDTESTQPAGPGARLTSSPFPDTGARL